MITPIQKNDYTDNICAPSPAPSPASGRGVNLISMVQKFAEIRRLEELLSTWIPTSELSRVNAAAGVSPVHVSLDTWTVVQRAMQAAEMTGGGG